MCINERSAKIVSSTIKLAKSINSTVTAVGIEKESELVYLREYGCEYGQGQYCSPALDATAVMALLNRRQPVLLR
jgi:EAL domain-containing protein (putative c-di-GMP-specific phosphodiesterase class I)